MRGLLDGSKCYGQGLNTGEEFLILNMVVREVLTEKVGFV